ncbi:DnaJ subfamily C member 2 [Blattella germanica]|nr:DnaJ subfamily C member 2 [Blattella germanica]
MKNYLTTVNFKEEVDECTSDIAVNEDLDFLRSLDPKEWKQQDHYRVLGLEDLRYKSKEDDIKKAYRLKVLRHHPDKRRSRGEEVHTDDDYFTCITKAYEIHGNRRSRRSYDSVDPTFDNAIPQLMIILEVISMKWSEKSPVPELGDESSQRDQVEKFYCFWYNFRSWREYSYLDEEEKDQALVREERRWIERLNKAVLAKLKKEEMSRIRTLILEFRDSSKDKKLAAKEARKVAARAGQAEKEHKALILEEERRRLKEEEQA